MVGSLSALGYRRRRRVLVRKYSNFKQATNMVVPLNLTTPNMAKFGRFKITSIKQKADLRSAINTRKAVKHSGLKRVAN